MQALTTKVMRALLLGAVVVALGWFAVDRTPEPLIAVMTAIVGLLSLRRAGDGPARARRRTSAAADRIAVLPLQNIAEVAGKDYFADGLTEELISVLSRVRGLEVIARGSVSRYRDRSRPIAEIGAELNVGAVLEGSVRAVGDELRITVRLVDVASESNLWSADYDRRLTEIFAVQRNIAVEVARSLEVSILEGDADRLGRVPTSDLEAYDLYLLGRHALNRRTEEGVRRSIDRFRAAVEKDPSFAAAHAGIADAYVLSAIGYARIPREVAMREAEAASTRAIEAQETLSDAHTSYGFVLLNFDWDWAAAEAEFERALELNPSDARAFQWFAQCQSYQRRFEEAIPLARKAQELDPRSPLIATEAGWPFLYLGRLDEARTRFEHALELDPDFALAHMNVGNVLEADGKIGEALARYERAADLSGRAPMFVAFVARALARLGRRGAAESVLREVSEGEGAEALSSVYVAHVYEALGETDEALAALERAVADRDPMTLAVGTRWLPFSRIAGVPRYRRVLERLPIHAADSSSAVVHRSQQM